MKYWYVINCSFSRRDQDNVEFVLKFCSSVIANTLAYHRELTLKKQNQTLLQVARNLFSRLRDLNKLLSEIMNEARSLTNAEKSVIIFVVVFAVAVVERLFLFLVVCRDQVNRIEEM